MGRTPMSAACSQKANTAQTPRPSKTVSAVGTGCNAVHANLREAVRVLGNEAIALHGVVATSDRLTFLIPRADVKRAVGLLHEALVSRSVT
jgi:aspartokinase